MPLSTPINHSPKVELSQKRSLSPELSTQPHKRPNWRTQYNKDRAKSAAEASRYENALEDYYTWHRQEFGGIPELWGDPGND